jgi:hypothetical protein
MSITEKKLNAIAEKVARTLGLSPDVTTLLPDIIGHNWQKPCAQIPTLGVTSVGDRMVASETGADDRLYADGYVMGHSNLGTHRTLPAINPLTGRRVAIFPFMTPKAVSVFGEALYAVHAEAFPLAHPGYSPISKLDFLNELQAKVDSLLTAGFIGEPIIHAGVSGTLVKEGIRYLTILTPTGIQRVRR